jgi:hypothetical protein
MSGSDLLETSFSLFGAVAPMETECALVEQLERGRKLGRFTDIDPTANALSIQGALWARVERQWATGDYDRAEVRRSILQFCLRGLGVDQASIAEVLTDGTTHLAAARLDP